MYINSPGGQIDAGLAIYDTMHLIQPAVATTCIGMAASMGAVLLGGGPKAKRSALPNSRILIHQASAGFQGTASDIEVQAREILRMNARLQEMMAADTGQSVERVGRDINRDYWMSASEAKDYGVIDMIHGQTAATAAADLPRQQSSNPPNTDLQYRQRKTLGRNRACGWACWRQWRGVCHPCITDPGTRGVHPDGGSRGARGRRHVVRHR